MGGLHRDSGGGHNPNVDLCGLHASERSYAGVTSRSGVVYLYRGGDLRLGRHVYVVGERRQHESRSDTGLDRWRSGHIGAAHLASYAWSTSLD